MKNLTKQQKIILGISAAVIIIAAIILAFVLKKPAKTEKAETTAENTEETVVDDGNHDGLAKSLLTGKWINEIYANSRPYAIMTENTKVNMPQYGLNSAGVIYECPVEGGITRLMAIYDDTSNLTQIGNVRSCRPYYAYIASEYKAVYVHYGQSVQGEEVLNSGIVDDLNGLGGEESVTFFRTDEHPKPHNAYTSNEGLIAGTAYKDIDLSLPSDYSGHFKFAEDDSLNELSSGSDCKYVSLYFFNNSPYFVYDEDSHTYLRYQFGDKQIDKVDGNQVAVTNIILQNVDSSIYEGTQYLNIPLVGSGTGKCISNGKIIDITWSKESDTGVTHYYDTDGNEIVLNQGQTWISLIQNPYADQNVYSAEVPQ